MLKKSKLFSELYTSTPDIRNPNQINQYKLFCYGFRSGGFVDATKNATELAIQSVSLDGTLRELLRVASCLDGMLALRRESLPSDYTPDTVVEIFKNYVSLVERVLQNLESAKQKAEEKEKHEIQTIYQNFKAAMERVTNSNGLCVLNPKDEFLSQHGAIDLPDQGLKIVQMIFTNDLGLHFATVSPDSSFYHSHGDLSELHFVKEECPYEHFVSGKRFQITEADVVAMAPEVPHGGRNISDTEDVTLYFIAGDFTYGPWRLDFNDRTNHPMDDLKQARDIGELNGALLESTINKMLRDSVDHKFIISPSQCAGRTGYGIGLELISVESIEAPIKGDCDHIIKVWDGKGSIDVNGIETRLGRQDCFSIPAGISYIINPYWYDEKMVLLRFGLYQLL